MKGKFTLISVTDRKTGASLSRDFDRVGAECRISEIEQGAPFFFSYTEDLEGVIRTSRVVDWIHNVTNGIVIVNTKNTSYVFKEAPANVNEV